MTVYKTGVEFSTNVGLLERDYQRATTAAKVFGADTATGLATATAAQDKVALASQRVVAADTQLRASRERLNAVMASGLATQRELAAAQTGFVASQERLVAAQTAQARIMREQQATTVSAPSRGGGLFGLAAGFAATTAAFKIKDAIEAGARSAATLATVDQQLAATLASTGNVANTSVTQIDRNSVALSHQTGISEEATRAGALLALTFTRIRNEGAGSAAIFDRVQTTAANMAIGLHEAHGGAIDFQGAIQLLGRALNDPARGLDTLRRSGVQFTAQQRDQIKTLADSGKTLQAQQIILDLVNQKFAHAAQLYGGSAAGAYDKAREAVDELERSLASPLINAGVPMLHTLTSTIEFLTAHPIITQFTELGVGLTGVAFAAAAFEKAVRFLKESEWLSAIAKWLFGYRSMGRAIATVVGEEDAQASAANRTAEAVNLEAAAMERATGAANNLALAQGRVAATGGGGGAVKTVETATAGGFLGRALGGVGRAAGVIGLGDVVAEIIGPHLHSGGFTTAYRLGQANQLIGTLHGLIGTQGDPSQTFLGANQAQRTAVASIYNVGIGPALKAANDGRGDLTALRDLIGQVEGAYSKYAHTVRDSAASIMPGQHELANIYVAQRDAIFEADSADAQAASNRAARLEKAFRQARALQAGVNAGNVKAVATIEGMIGVPQASIFDPVNPNANKQASAAASVGSAQVSATSAQRAVTLAESRLNALRATGKATALQLQSAETSLANARDRAAVSSDRLTAAEKKSQDTQPLSIADALQRAEAQVTNDRGQAAAAQRFVQLGVTEPVMQALLQLDQQAPGTFQRIAAHLTQAGANQLNRDHRMADAARHSLDKAFAASNTKTADDAARRAAAAAAQAWQQAYLAALRDPKFWQIVNTDLGRLLLGNQGVLPSRAPGGSGTGSHGGAPTLGGVLGQGLPQRGDGGYIPGAAGSPTLMVGHGGEYVLSRNMLAGRQPIGVALGMTDAQRSAPQVVVHVHTAASTYSTKHEWHNTIKAGSPREFETWADGNARLKAVTP